MGCYYFKVVSPEQEQDIVKEGDIVLILVPQKPGLTKGESCKEFIKEKVSRGCEEHPWERLHGLWTSNRDKNYENEDYHYKITT